MTSSHSFSITFQSNYFSFELQFKNIYPPTFGLISNNVTFLLCDAFFYVSKSFSFKNYTVTNFGFMKRFIHVDSLAVKI